MNSNSHLSEIPCGICFRLPEDKLLYHQVTYGKHQTDLLHFYKSVHFRFEIMGR